MGQLCYNAAMATITVEVPDKLAQRLESVRGRLPALLDYALDMSGIPGSSIAPENSPFWSEVIEFLAGGPGPEEILAFKISDDAQERLEDLLYLNREETLTPQEQDELDAFAQIDHLFIMLKAYSRQANSSA